MKKKLKKIFKPALIRSFRTMCQTAVALIGTSSLLSEVDWLMVLSSTGLAGLLSLLSSLGGLPEVKED